jgi:hypothetical protein
VGLVGAGGGGGRRLGAPPPRRRQGGGDPLGVGRLVSVAVAGLTASAVVGAVYLYASPVAAADIDGVQGRYFIPVLPLLAAAAPAVRAARRLGSGVPAAVVFGGGCAVVLASALVAYLQRAYGWL